MKSVGFLFLSNVFGSARFTQSPGVITGISAIHPNFSAFNANVSHFWLPFNVAEVDATNNIPDRLFS
jgi:hypothetical protein